MKCLCVNITKHVLDLYSENYKTVIKEIQEHPVKWNKHKYTMSMDLNTQ